MNLTALIQNARKLNLPLEQENLRIETQHHNDQQTLLQAITDFAPAAGWIQTTEKVITRDWLAQLQRPETGWVEHAELINASHATLQIQPAGHGWRTTQLTPAEDGEPLLFLTERHAVRSQPERALTYRIYFTPDDTRAPRCARLVKLDKE